jgi:electron transfer flavoprotein alpha subunit
MKFVELKSDDPDEKVFAVNPALVRAIIPVSKSKSKCKVIFSDGVSKCVNESFKMISKKLNDGLSGADVVLTVGRGNEATRFRG